MLLNLNDIVKSFGRGAAAVRVLDGVSLSVGAGDSLALTGESGSGKSTLLHICAGLEVADGGQVSIDGRDLSGMGDRARAALRRQVIGLVFQQFNLIPSLSVAANIAFQARLAGVHDPDWDRALAARLGLGDLLHRYPEQLSGGQQQRVAIGRALAARPRLILADEPTGNLDEGSSDEVLQLLLELVREAGAALVMVTHSDRLAQRLDRRLHLSGGQVQ